MGDELDDIIERMEKVCIFRDGQGLPPPELLGPDGKSLARDIWVLARRLKALEEKIG